MELKGSRTEANLMAAFAGDLFEPGRIAAYETLIEEMVVAFLRQA